LRAEDEYLRVSRGSRRMPFYLQFPPVGGQVLGFPSGAAKLTGAKAASISAASRIRRAFFTVELLF